MPSNHFEITELNQILLVYHIYKKKNEIIILDKYYTLKFLNIRYNIVFTLLVLHDKDNDTSIRRTEFLTNTHVNVNVSHPYQQNYIVIIYVLHRQK